MLIVGYNLFQLMDVIIDAPKVFKERANDGIIASTDRLKVWLVKNMVFILALSPAIDHQKRLEIAHEVVNTGSSSD